VETEKRKRERDAVLGDPHAQDKVAHDRCRNGECCAHGKDRDVGRIIQVIEGCGSCPFTDLEASHCDLENSIDLPVDSQNEVIDACHMSVHYGKVHKLCA